MNILGLQWINNAAIDKERYNACIDRCEWGKVYALSWYLDLLTDNQWELLVYGDYEYVMPVPFRKKFGLRYTYRPNFCQQLGVFGSNRVTHDMLKNFLKALKKRYYHIHYPLNHANFNEWPSSSKESYLVRRTNLVLDLSRSYEEIAANYSRDLKKNLKKAQNAGLGFQQDIETKEVISIYKGAWQSKNYIPEKDYSNYFKVIEFSKKIGISTNLGIIFNGKTVASCCIFKYKNRIYYPFSGITPEGRNNSAIALLIDNIISINSNSNSYFDFEGSDIESVRFFYEKFRPSNESYFLINVFISFWD